MTDHTPTPWRVEQNTDLVWGACNPDDKSSYGMGYAIVEGKSGEKYSSYKPDMDEREANAAFIVKAVNNHEALVAELEAVKARVTVLEMVIAEELTWQDCGCDLNREIVGDIANRRLGPVGNAGSGS